jgi:hypothetical protein
VGSTMVAWLALVTGYAVVQAFRSRSKDRADDALQLLPMAVAQACQAQCGFDPYRQQAPALKCHCSHSEVFA